MVDDILSALISFAVALVVAFPLGKALKKHPAPFYLGAALLVGAHMWYRQSGSYVAWAQVFVDTMQKSFLACAFLAIVMFCGVFDEGSAVRRRLQPVRAELSILSFILMLSHVFVFLPDYLPRLGMTRTSHTALTVSIVVAMLLVVVYALLTATSLRVLRAKIPRKTWKNVQRLSYLMVALLYAHILLALGKTVFVGHGSGAARVALAVYTVLLALYAALRIAKAVRDRRHKAARAREARS